MDRPLDRGNRTATEKAERIVLFIAMAWRERGANRCSDHGIDGILKQKSSHFQEADPRTGDLGTRRSRTMATATALISWDEFLALPDDGMVHDLIQKTSSGRKPMTKRNRNQ